MFEGMPLSVRRGSGLVLVGLAWALFLSLTGSPEALLFTVPLFLIAAPLAFGRYLGEDLFVALATRSRPRVRRAVPAFAFPRFEVAPRVLIDCALSAGRAPPATA